MAIRQPAESVIDQAHHEGVSLRGAAASLTNLREANEFRTIQAIMAISWELLVCHASALGISGQIRATKEGATRSRTLDACELHIYSACAFRPR